MVQIGSVLICEDKSIPAIGKPLGVPCMKKKEEQINVVLLGGCQNWFKIWTPFI